MTIIEIKETEKLVESLKAGVVCFSYKKVSDGSVRIAHGTLNPDLIPQRGAELFKDMKEVILEQGDIMDRGMGVPKEGATIHEQMQEALKLSSRIKVLAIKLQPKASMSRPASPDELNYWDFGANQFRKFKLSNLIQFVKE